MKRSLGSKSILLFVLSFVFLLVLTFFESSLSGISITMERIISALFLVVPGIIGVILGIMSLTRKESRPWVAILGVLLNGAFALFHIFVLSFAG
jgi:hypothetical protein